MITEGTLINERYKVLGLLGEGGMGAVYAGEHVGVGRRVAIKVLHPEYIRHAEVVERFEREAKAAAAIGHDHIIDVLDFGRHEGQPFMVMEHLKGESLDARLGHFREGMPVEMACEIMGQTLSALGAAHAAGVVHRDMKPDNVFLVPKGGRDFVKLLDFGISKFGSDGGSPMGKSLTKTGALMGTPAYMAPEQALAKRDADHRVDLYATGVMLYEMLTGKIPFDADSETELLLAIVHRPQGLEPPHALTPSIPPELSAVVMKAMALDRKDRFETAAAFHEALVPYGAHPVDGAEPPPSRSSGLLSVPGKNPTSMGWERRSQAGMASGASSAGEVPQARKRSGATGMLAAFGAVALLGVGGGVFAVVRSHATTAAAPVAARGSAATSASAAATEGATVQVELEGLPSGAEVTLDGERAEGSVLRLERNSTHMVRVVAQGKQPFETRVVADRDRTLAVALADAPAAVAAPSGSAAAATSNPTARAGVRRGNESAASPAAAQVAAAQLADAQAAAQAAANEASARATARPRPRPSASAPLLQVDTTF